MYVVLLILNVEFAAFLFVSTQNGANSARGGGIYSMKNICPGKNVVLSKVSRAADIGSVGTLHWIISFSLIFVNKDSLPLSSPQIMC